jgi:hypothetical protein
LWGMVSSCHCEADEVSRSNLGGAAEDGDCHASLAMTNTKRGIKVKKEGGKNEVNSYWTGAVWMPDC